MPHRPAMILVAALAWSVPAAIDAQAKPPALVASVASSLADVMSELARRHERATGQAVRLNVAGSNVLARQIVEGAPADLFVSADDAQMDVVERAGRLVPGSRLTLLTNQLVVVGSPATALRVTGPRSLADPGGAAPRPRQSRERAGRRLRATVARAGRDRGRRWPARWCPR